MNPKLQPILGWWQGESEATIRMIQAIPADKLNKKVHDKFKTAAELAAHLIESIDSIADSIDAGKAVFTAIENVPNNVDTLVKMYKDAYEKSYKKVETLTDKQLQQKLPMEMNGELVWNPTTLEMISGYICHEVHHRGQLSLMIRLFGGKVPGTYGPSGDEMEM